MPLRLKSQIDDLYTSCQGSHFVSMKVKVLTVAHKALSGPGPRAPALTHVSHFLPPASYLVLLPRPGLLPQKSTWITLSPVSCQHSDVTTLQSGLP